MARTSDPVFSQGDIMRRLAALEAKVRELTAGRRLEAATIGRGGITVKGGSIRLLDDDGNLIAELGRDGNAYGLRVLDGSGNSIAELGKDEGGRYGFRVRDTDGDVRIRAGELVSEPGEYGLEVVDENGQGLSLSTLAFGLRGDTVSALAFTESSSFGDLTLVPSGNSPGPSVQVDISSTGRAIVILSAFMSMNSSGSAAMSFAATGANSISPDDQRAFSNTTVAISWSVGSGRVLFLDGLDAGMTTFAAKYKRTTGSAPAVFSDRSIIVIPY